VGHHAHAAASRDMRASARHLATSMLAADDQQQFDWRRSRRPFPPLEEAHNPVLSGDYLGILVGAREGGVGRPEWATGGLPWPELP
jgi:hypothetical protein